MPRDEAYAGLPVASNENPLALDAALRDQVAALAQTLLPPWGEFRSPGPIAFAHGHLPNGAVDAREMPPDQARLMRLMNEAIHHEVEISRLHGTRAVAAVIRSFLFHHPELVAPVALQSRFLIADLVADTRAGTITRADVHAGMSASYEAWPDRALDLPPVATPQILTQLDGALCVRHGVETPEEGFARQRLPKTPVEWWQAAMHLSSEKLNLRSVHELHDLLLILATTLVVHAEGKTISVEIAEHIHQLQPVIAFIQEQLAGNQHPAARKVLGNVGRYQGSVARGQAFVDQVTDQTLQLPDGGYLSFIRDQRHSIAPGAFQSMLDLWKAQSHRNAVRRALEICQGDVQRAMELAAHAPIPATLDGRSTGVLLPTPKRLLRR